MDDNIGNIITMGHPTLAAVAKEVSPTSRKTKQIVKQLIASLDFLGGGLGLAAPQININKRVIIYTILADRCENQTEIPMTALINPEIIEYKGHVSYQWEACFSLPGLMGRVPRYHEISYRYQQTDGKTMTCVATGFHARVLQHETDHLDGFLYIQRMDDLSQLGYADEIRQHHC